MRDLDWVVLEHWLGNLIRKGLFFSLNLLLRWQNILSYFSFLFTYQLSFSLYFIHHSLCRIEIINNNRRVFISDTINFFTWRYYLLLCLYFIDGSFILYKVRILLLFDNLFIYLWLFASYFNDLVHFHLWLFVLLFYWLKLWGGL